MGFCSILLNLLYLDLQYESRGDVIISSMTSCYILFILGYVFIWQWFIYLVMFAYSQDSVILKLAYTWNKHLLSNNEPTYAESQNYTFD